MSLEFVSALTTPTNDRSAAPKHLPGAGLRMHRPSPPCEWGRRSVRSSRQNHSIGRVQATPGADDSPGALSLTNSSCEITSTHRRRTLTVTVGSFGGPVISPEHARWLPATAIHRRTRLIGKVGIETLLNGSRRQPQGSLAKSHLQSLEIQLRHRLAT